jgi:hypothetical protein
MTMTMTMMMMYHTSSWESGKCEKKTLLRRAAMIDLANSYVHGIMGGEILRAHEAGDCKSRMYRFV